MLHSVSSNLYLSFKAVNPDFSGKSPLKKLMIKRQSTKGASQLHKITKQADEKES